MTFQRQPGNRLEWALLVPVAAPRLDELVRSLELGVYVPDDDDESPTWHVVAGAGRYSALIETEPGSMGGEVELAIELSRALDEPVYALGFSGYDDPDEGLPFIVVYEGGARKLIWMGDADLDEDLPGIELSPGPEGIPCDDPFEFSQALGCGLRPFY